MTTNNDNISDLTNKVSVARIWTKPETQNILKMLRKEPKLFKVEKIDDDFYTRYQVTTVDPICKNKNGEYSRGIVLDARSSKYDNSYLVRHHKDLFLEVEIN